MFWNRKFFIFGRGPLPNNLIVSGFLTLRLNCFYAQIESDDAGCDC